MCTRERAHTHSQGAILGRKFRTDKTQGLTLNDYAAPTACVCITHTHAAGRCFERDIQKILVIMNILGAFEGASSSLVGGDSMSLFCNLPYQHTGITLSSHAKKRSTHTHTHAHPPPKEKARRIYMYIPHLHTWKGFIVIHTRFLNAVLLSPPTSRYYFPPFSHPPLLLPLPHP